MCNNPPAPSVKFATAHLGTSPTPSQVSPCGLTASGLLCDSVKLDVIRTPSSMAEERRADLGLFALCAASTYADAPANTHLIGQASPDVFDTPTWIPPAAPQESCNAHKRKFVEAKESTHKYQLLKVVRKTNYQPRPLIKALTTERKMQMKLRAQASQQTPSTKPLSSALQPQTGLSAQARKQSPDIKALTAQMDIDMAISVQAVKAMLAQAMAEAQTNAAVNAKAGAQTQTLPHAVKCQWQSVSGNPKSVARSIGRAQQAVVIKSEPVATSLQTTKRKPKAGSNTHKHVEGTAEAPPRHFVFVDETKELPSIQWKVHPKSETVLCHER